MACKPSTCDTTKVLAGSGKNQDCVDKAALDSSCDDFLYCNQRTTNPRSTCEQSIPTPIPSKDASKTTNAIYYMILAIVILIILILFFYLKRPQGAGLNPTLLKVLTTETSK